MHPPIKPNIDCLTDLDGMPMTQPSSAPIGAPTIRVRANILVVIATLGSVNRPVPPTHTGHQHAAHSIANIRPQ